VSKGTRLPRSVWLLRDGDVLAAAEVVDSYAARKRVMTRHAANGGALLIERTRSVHTFGMRSSIDVAFLDEDLTVIDVAHVPPWRMTVPRLRCKKVLEAESGAFERWRLRQGDRLELREVP
jgi:uncharacterized membrane protein (UPF0127 family)